jgi:hypothetical protein
MSYVRLALIAIPALVLASCQTITEELPVATVITSSSPVPIIVVAVPVPQPSTQPQPAPSGGGGGGGGGSSPVPQPVPIPQPVPQPVPSGDNGGGGGGGGGGENPPGSAEDIVSVHAYVYYIQCRGQAQPNTKFAEEGPADCDVRLDATAKNARGRGIDTNCDPRWSINGARWATPGNPYTPLVFGGAPGEFTAQVELCGVTSNSFSYRFR